MPRKSPAHDQRIITYRTLPDSSRQYQRVNVAECKAWVQTNLEELGKGRRVVRKVIKD
jgi:hypothetical protein